MNVHRGDVVLVDFPFSSGTARKLRPAVIVQNDHNNRRLASAIFAPIISNIRRNAEPTQVIIDLSTAEGRQTGLLKPSVIKCENLATIEKQLIQRKIGTLPPPLIAQLETALKHSLGLS
jgi:mRNA interferase MazF